ncbi:MAG: 3-deoxy-D-manno-octulosonic acid transferase [Proteobacteria bacterium]|nr:3-deoxy-D-manno-octulosonic acid transferase [Pseudomonadota bacterium]
MPGESLKTGRAGPPTSAGEQPPDRLGIATYRLMTRLATPLAPLILGYRERRGKEEPSRRAERLGLASIPRPGGLVIWVHAASVGETSAVLPLIAALEERLAGLTVLLTTGTVTSARFAAQRASARTLHQYVPLDAPSFVGAFLDHWRPQLGIFTEQEVWPNLVLEARGRGIPLALVNARMSDKSFDRWQRRQKLAEALFSRFSVVLAQNETLAHRFEAIGARRVRAVGSLKIDAPPPPVDAKAFAALEQALGGRERMVAASTHEGEEAAVAAAHKWLRAKHPALLTILAPRHPERGAQIAETLSGEGLRVSRRSAGELPAAETDIYVADTIGELGTLYASTPVAFIGGSLIAHGGQNPIEAVRHGAVVVTGPSTHNFADVYEALIGAGGAVQVANAAELGPAFGALLGDAAHASTMRANATRALAALGGALERTLAELLPYLDAGRIPAASQYHA